MAPGGPLWPPEWLRTPLGTSRSDFLTFQKNRFFQIFVEKKNRFFSEFFFIFDTRFFWNLIDLVLLESIFPLYLFLVNIGSTGLATRLIWMPSIILSARTFLSGILFTWFCIRINSWFMRSVPLSEAFRSPNFSKSFWLLYTMLAWGHFSKSYQETSF